MDWTQFKCLFWNANDSLEKLMVSVSSGVSLWYRTCYKNISNYDSDNAENLRQNKDRFSLLAEQILLIILH